MPEPIQTQQAFWNEWNASNREKDVAAVSLEQANVVLSWLRALDRTDLRIIDVGCGAGWLCRRLTSFGRVTGTDLSDEVLSRAAQRLPEVSFIAGDFMALDLGLASYDVVVTLEVLPHVADQPMFLAKIAGLLRPGGYLMMATQNKPALLRNDVPPPKTGQLRRWVDRHELKLLLAPHFDVTQMFSITPMFNRGVLRVLNSQRLKRLSTSAKLRSVFMRVKRWQEQMWLGWTIMVLARKLESSDPRVSFENCSAPTGVSSVTLG
jgi:2-polyprenyl-3-methyl-5-hydroxy-6-metoxy-1,4-benzoquinol methylase